MPKSALKFRLERRKSIDPIPTSSVMEVNHQDKIAVKHEPRATALSMISMMSEKIRIEDEAEELPADLNDRSARRSYIFNDYRVEETYAGPG